MKACLGLTVKGICGSGRRWTFWRWRGDIELICVVEISLGQQIQRMDWKVRDVERYWVEQG